MNIIIYSTTTCAFCSVLSGWLDKQNIAYTKKNTDEDESALAEFMSINDGNLGVPFTLITDDSGKQTKILGFDQPAFKAALHI